ncbi:hypothetical protein D3C71_1427200 [compost metagenome]
MSWLKKKQFVSKRNWKLLYINKRMLKNISGLKKLMLLVLLKKHKLKQMLNPNVCKQKRKQRLRKLLLEQNLKQSVFVVKVLPPPSKRRVLQKLM